MSARAKSIFKDKKLKKNSDNPTCKNINFDKEVILANHKSLISFLNIPINEENDDLPTLYWIQKLHKNLYREGYIAGSSTNEQ